MHLALKCLFTPPKFGILGRFNRYMGSSINVTLKCTFWNGNTSYDVQIVKTGATYVRDNRSKEDKGNLPVANLVLAQTTHLSVHQNQPNSYRDVSGQIHFIPLLQGIAMVVTDTWTAGARQV